MTKEEEKKMKREMWLLYYSFKIEVNKIIRQRSIESMETIKKSLEKINNQVVRTWYDDYEPHVYRYRKNSLFQFLKISIDYDKLSLSINFSPKNSQAIHRVDRGRKPNRRYIYYNSFIMGYHGGADCMESAVDPKFLKPPHPDQKTPYWRTPIRVSGYEVRNGHYAWEYWFTKEPTARTLFDGLGPYDKIIQLFQIDKMTFMKKIEEKYNKLLLEEKSKFLKQLNDCKNTYKKRKK